MMSWIYNSANGTLAHNGVLVGIGYSGRGSGLNNPSEESVPDVGPIPRGEYTIGTFMYHPKLGQLVASLTPEPETDDFGRGGFFIHGDNKEMDRTGSEGCIVLGHDIRQAMANSTDRDLFVA